MLTYQLQFNTTDSEVFHLDLLRSPIARWRRRRRWRRRGNGDDAHFDDHRREHDHRQCRGPHCERVASKRWEAQGAVPHSRLALPEEWARGEISPDITSRLTEDTPARARDARTDTRGSTNTRARAARMRPRHCPSRQASLVGHSTTTTTMTRTATMTTTMAAATNDERESLASQSLWREACAKILTVPKCCSVCWCCFVFCF